MTATPAMRPLYCPIDGRGTAEQLMGECQACWELGDDFETIWSDILGLHPLTAGPAERVDGIGQHWLEVPLFDGQTLVFRARDGFQLLTMRRCAA